jgi:hypothetical protein
MTYLREAVEKKRQYFIKLLIQAGVLQSTNPSIEKLTLSELEYLYKKLQNKKT